LPVYVPFSFFLFGAAVPISFSSKSDLQITEIHVKLVSKWRRKGIDEKITSVLQSAGNLLVISKFTIRSWLEWRVGHAFSNNSIRNRLDPLVIS
jgi:hypothetical protein